MNALAVTLLLGLVAVCTALDCYVCDSTDTTCSDMYSKPADHKTACDSSETGCSKLKSSGKILGITATSVVRTCGTLYDNTQCAQADRAKASLLGAKSEVWSCSCEGDSCNDGNSVTLGLSLFAAVFAAKLLL